MGFEVKDSGNKESFASGMNRDSEKGKRDYTLLLPLWFMFDRFVDHLQKGAEKYGKNNYMLADSKEELERTKRSLFRHMIDYMKEDRSEDHAAAIIFNLAQIERLRPEADPKEDIRHKFDLLVEIETDTDEEGHRYKVAEGHKFLETIFRDYQITER